MTHRLLLVASLFALACATDGRFDYDAAVDFSAYKTFAVISPTEGEGELPLPTQDVVQSQLVERRARQAIERGLTEKGLAATAESEADLIVAFTVGSRRASRPESVPDGIGPHWPYGWWYDHWDRAYTRIYTEGLLIVDLIDAKTRRLVWRGWTTDPVSASTDIDRKVKHAVGTVLAGYPPAPVPPVASAAPSGN